MSSYTALISNTPSSIVSKFGKKEKIVYVVPSIDECLALLPRHLGNLILSYTSSFLLFYIDNLVKKYGEKFVNETFDNVIYRRIKFINLQKQTQKDRVERFIKYSLKLNTPRDIIVSSFQNKIQERTLLIQSQQQQKLQKKSHINFYLAILNVGDIIRTPCHTYFIVEKSKLCYYSIRVDYIQSQSENIYHTLYIDRFSIDIIRNLDYTSYGDNFEILPKKQLKIIKFHLSVVLNPTISNKHKRDYILDLFGYKKLRSNEYMKNYDY